MYELPFYFQTHRPILLFNSLKFFLVKRVTIAARIPLVMQSYNKHYLTEFPHEEKRITLCGYTQENMNFPRRGNSLKFDFPHMRIYTYNCEFPLVEMHPKMCISAVRIYTNFGVLPHSLM